MSHPERKCGHCSKPFRPKRSHGVYCSNTCASNVRMTRWRRARREKLKPR